MPRTENFLIFSLVYVLLGLAMVSMCMAALKDHIRQHYEQHIPSALRTITAIPAAMNKITAIAVARRLQPPANLEDKKDSVFSRACTGRIGSISMEIADPETLNPAVLKDPCVDI